MHTVDEIVEYFGSKRALAGLLDMAPQSLTRWDKHGIPAGVAIEIEKLSGGKFKAVDIPIYSTKSKAA